jgi:two-component system, OmpR family, response regulator RegX3
VSRVLIVEDEPAVRDALDYSLRGEGFDVDAAPDGEAGLRAAQSGDYDVVILDLMLPKMSGTEVCRRLRSESAVPIIMLTAKGAELDRVLGLEIGADDYVTKPFSMAELIGRIRAILRRRQLDRSGATSTLRVGDLELDPIRHEVRIRGEPKRLTPSEFKLLLLLAQDPERVFSRREIMQHLWDSSYVGDQRACDIHISNLRQKIEEDPGNPARVETVRGVGYKLTPVGLPRPVSKSTGIDR